MNVFNIIAQSNVGVLEDINIKNKGTAAWEILIMLAGAYLLGFATYWLIHQFVHGANEEEVESSSPATPVRRGASMTPDDLTLIEGVGPKINELLQDAGINTFQELADAPASRVKRILDDAGSRFRTHDPKTWAQQAQLAADGNFDELEALQEKLDGGK